MVNFQDWIFQQLPFRFKEEDTYKDINGKGLFERFIEAHGYELDTYVTPMIGGLTELNSVLTTDEAYVAYIAWLLGNPPDTIKNPEAYHRLLRYILDINKVKGTTLGYELFFKLLGIEVTVNENPLTEAIYDSELHYDSDNYYDGNCPPCSGYTLTINDPNGVLDGWEEDPVLEAMFLAIVKYLEPINARMVSWEYTGPNTLNPDALVFDIEMGVDGALYGINLSSELGYPSFSIDWGDGNMENIEYESYISHYYETAGIYRIIILGTVPYLNPEPGVIEIVQWGNCDFYGIRFGSYFGNILRAIPNGPITGAPNLVSVGSLFMGATEWAQQIPENLFSLCPLIEDVGSAFMGCSGLHEPIPEGLFANNPLIGSFVDTFNGCTGISGTIPENLFRYNISVNTLGFHQTFRGCTNLQGPIPQDLFRYNTEVYDYAFYNTFYNCTGLTGSIPEDLFRYNTQVRDYAFYGTFYNCTGLTGSIPVNLFRYNTQARDYAFYNTFYNCTGLTGSIPEDLFRYNTQVRDYAFYGTFTHCNNLTGSIPVNLFRYNTQARDYAFYNTFSCPNITGSIPEDLFRYNTLVRYGAFQYTFSGCISLSGPIPVNLFRYNTQAQHILLPGGTVYGAFLGTFYNCTSLTGSIPEDLFRYNTLAGLNSFSNTFYGCSSLTGSIPVGLFQYNTLATIFNSTFYNCTGLTGAIPADLFRYNIGAISFATAFHSCTGLTEAPDNLFRYNPLAENFRFIFYGCSNLKLNPYIFYPKGEESTFFADRTLDFTDCFNRASYTGVQGTAPALWDCTFGSVTRTRCFAGAGNNTSSLSNYNDIPLAWR